jgi:ribosomal subunit interface protein
LDNNEDIMQLPLQISFRNMETSPTLEAHIRERAEKLDRFAERIMSCRVTVEQNSRHQRKGRHYRVGIAIKVPGQEIAVGRDSGDDPQQQDPYLAVSHAFDAARRRMEDFVRKQRGDVKTHEAPDHGKIARIFHREGYGFIAASDGREIYFHKNSVGAGDFDKFLSGDEVRFVTAVDPGDKGPQASSVSLLGKHHYAG